MIYFFHESILYKITLELCAGNTVKKIFSFLILGFLIFILAGCRIQNSQTKLSVQDAWIRAIGSNETTDHSMEMQPETPEAEMGLTTAAFMLITNTGEDDRLLSVESDLAQVVELHRSEMKGDVMTMRPAEGIDIHAGETVELISGGYHMMLVNLQHEIKPGEKYTLTLVFEKAGSLIVEAEVRSP